MLHKLITFLSFFLVSLASTALDLTDEELANPTIPVKITIKSLAKLRVKLGQEIRVGQILAPRPVSTVYISKKPEREVEKQKAKLKKVRQVVEAENLSPIFVEHEEAKLRDLEFAAQEHKLMNQQAEKLEERFYQSPVKGIIRRITPLSSSNGLLTVELVVELQ